MKYKENQYCLGFSMKTAMFTTERRESKNKIAYPLNRLRSDDLLQQLHRDFSEYFPNLVLRMKHQVLAIIIYNPMPVI